MCGPVCGWGRVSPAPCMWCPDILLGVCWNVTDEIKSKFVRVAKFSVVKVFVVFGIHENLLRYEIFCLDVGVVHFSRYVWKELWYSCLPCFGKQFLHTRNDENAREIMYSCSEKEKGVNMCTSNQFGPSKFSFLLFFNVLHVLHFVGSSMRRICLPMNSFQITVL